MSREPIKRTIVAVPGVVEQHCGGYMIGTIFKQLPPFWPFFSEISQVIMAPALITPQSRIIL